MKVLINKDVIVYEEENEMILVNMIKNNFYALDYIGSLIWKLFQQTDDVSKVIDHICKEFNKEKEEIKNDIVEFVYELEKAGVIKIYEKS